MGMITGSELVPQVLIYDRMIEDLRDYLLRGMNLRI